MGKPRLTVLSNISGTCAHPIPPVPIPVVGIITVGSKDVLINNKPAATVTSNVVTTCPICGSGVVVSGDNTVLINGKPSAVVTSNVALGSGTIALALSGSNNVL